MAWAGLTLSVTRRELRQTIDRMQDDAGFVLRCPCGATRYCPVDTALTDSENFERLHAPCVRQKGSVL
jgi:hypothetical protein